MEEDDKQSVADLADLCNIHSARHYFCLMVVSNDMTEVEMCSLSFHTCYSDGHYNACLSSSPPGSKCEMPATPYTFPCCHHRGRLITGKKRGKRKMFTKLHFHCKQQIVMYVLSFNIYEKNKTKLKIQETKETHRRSLFQMQRK